MSNASYRIGLSWVILILGIFGVILPSLVDMFPSASWTSVLHLRELDIGFAELSDFNDTIRFSDTGEQKTGGVLYRNDGGYDAIYGLLQTINPELPSLQEMKMNSITPEGGAIFVYDGMTWDNEGGSLPWFRPVQLSLKERGVTPICELKDLPPLIRDYKVRFWSRVGSALALLALVAPFILLSDFLELPQKPTAPIKVVNPEVTPAKVNAHLSNQRAHKAHTWLLLVSVLCIILSVSLLRKSR